ncbi:MAG: hypothetical protein GYB30_04660 [Gammaproteobacteria bacterium]|jgi:hypothetical protein|nr:hypothetical protein [Gammaproteobacteria bacterium]
MTQQINANRWRHWHRWLALLVGLQMVLWSISGAYMVLFELPFIHGNHLVKPSHQSSIAQPTVEQFSAVVERFPRATQITLTSLWLNEQPRPVYHITRRGKTQLLDAQTLQPITLSADAISAIAKRTYALGEAPLAQLTLLTENAPSEISPSLLPVWQANFGDSGSTSLYFSAITGELVSKRHTYWRGFDLMWMLHIMDYDTRSDIQNNLLRAVIIGNALFMFTGVLLIIVTIFRRQAVRGRS